MGDFVFVSFGAFRPLFLGFIGRKILKNCLLRGWRGNEKQ
ncbi:hypothetical protein CPI37_0393 [Corynebacterium pseudotuberculosis]|nr:hypothetical protein CPI37_0393 [Corynebacterium pseudotuberculosis]